MWLADSSSKVFSKTDLQNNMSRDNCYYIFVEHSTMKPVLLFIRLFFIFSKMNPNCCFFLYFWYYSTKFILKGEKFLSNI